jgi:tRNA(Ile)-lysidine synthase
VALAWEREKVRLTSEVSHPPEPLPDVSLLIPGEAKLAAGTLRGEVLDAVTSGELARMLVVCGGYHALMDANVLRGGLTVGSRRPGDRFRPLGLRGTKRVQDLFIDRNVPRHQRDRTVIVRNAEHIVWIPGEGLDERVAVRPSSQRIAHLCFWPKS